MPLFNFECVSVLLSVIQVEQGSAFVTAVQGKLAKHQSKSSILLCFHNWDFHSEKMQTPVTVDL